MKFSVQRKLGITVEWTREKRRAIREAGERRRVENARLTASSERITEMQRRWAQSTVDRFLARSARIRPGALRSTDGDRSRARGPLGGGVQ